MKGKRGEKKKRGEKRRKKEEKKRNGNMDKIKINTEEQRMKQILQIFYRGERVGKRKLWVKF